MCRTSRGKTLIANKGTTVPAEKTVSEIQSTLASVRASSIMIDYEDGKPEAIAFKLIRSGNPIAFRLRANWQGIMAAMKKDKTIPRRLVCEDQARRVSWRVVRDWLRAQLTLIEAGAATIEEVMLPWAVTSDGTTVSQRILSGPHGFLALPDKSAAATTESKDGE